MQIVILQANCGVTAKATCRKHADRAAESLVSDWDILSESHQGSVRELLQFCVFVDGLDENLFIIFIEASSVDKDCRNHKKWDLNDPENLDPKQLDHCVVSQARGAEDQLV